MKVRALVVAALLATSTAPAAPVAQAAARNETRSLAGAYLAGRFAHQHDDWAAAAGFIADALAADPADRTLMQRAVIYRLGDGRTDAAVELAQRLQAGGDVNPVILTLLAVDAAKKGSSRQATAMLDKLHAGGIWGLATPLFRAWLAALDKDPDRALAALEPMAAAPGLSALRDLHAALILETAGRNGEAAKLFDKLVAQPQNAPMRVVQAAGGFYQRHGRGDDARRLYRRFAQSATEGADPDPLVSALEDKKNQKSAPPAPDARRGLAGALFDLSSALQQENLSEIALLYGRMALHLDPGFAVARLHIGDVLASRDQAEAALTEYRTVERDPVIGRAARLRAADALIALKRDDEATALLTALAGERPDLTDAATRLGDFHRAAKRWDAAIAAYDDALRRVGKPTERHWPLLYARAISHERAGHWPQAEADLKAALAFQPNDALLLNYLGYSWIDRGENLDQARAMVQRAVELRPRDGYIVDSLGWAQYKLGEYEAAATNLERAVELRPVDATINDHLGDAYWRVGRRAEARFQWLRAQRMVQPDDDQSLKAEIDKKLENGLPDAKTAGAGGKDKQP